MTSRRSHLVTSAVTGMLFLTAACSGSESAAPTTSGAPTTTIEPTAATTTAPPTTVASTTEPAPTTTPPTTEPAPTTAPPTVPPTTTAPPPDVDLTQFCFESEQAYLAAAITNVLTEPTPAQAEAALQFLVFTAEQSLASAPDGFGDEPARFAELVGQIDDAFAEYDYDTEAFEAAGGLDVIRPIVDEYEVILFDQLVPFLSDVCGTPLDLIDDQADKVGPMIDEASTWPLGAVTNQAGDIRLLTPVDWSETVGSLELDEVTFLQATTDTETFETSWDVPGVLVNVYYVEAGVAEPALRLDNIVAVADCGAPIETVPYDDGIYTGELRLFADCAGVGTAAAALAVTNADGDIEATLEFQFPGGPDQELLEQMLAGFVVGA